MQKLQRRSMTALAIALGALLSCPAAPMLAQELVAVSDGKAVDAVLSDGLGQDAGRWRTVVQEVFDPTTRRLDRRAYELFDPAPSRDLDVVWQPFDLKFDRPGRISGKGRLAWRKAGRLAWDRSAIVAAFTGEMRDGKPEGAGELVTDQGLIYEGAWRNGRADGEGRLQLASGEDYKGTFRQGFAQGDGEYVDATGEKFEGRFVAGLRNGRGKTTLPSGFAYTSEWVDGVESPLSRRVRLAQLGGASGAPAEDIRIGVTVERTPGLPKDVSPDDLVWYRSVGTGDKITVEPADTKLMDAWKGSGELQTQSLGQMRTGMFGLDDEYFNFTAPAFRLDFQNRSTAPVEITQLRLDVAESNTDTQPAIQLYDSTDPACGLQFVAPYSLENYGWSAAKNAKFRLSFGEAGKDAPQSLDIAKPVGDLKEAEKLEVTFAPELSAAGANLSALKAQSENGFPCPSKDLKACLQGVRSNPLLGKLGSKIALDGTHIVVPVRGVLEYKWLDSKGGAHDRSSPFKVKVGIGKFPDMAECGEGGSPAPARKAPLHLRLDAEYYSLPLSFHSTLVPGQAARYTLQVDARKSSQHLFRVTAVLADGREIKTRPISLLYFRPHPMPRT
jgi:hypothetical protein